MSASTSLPIPPHFNPTTVGEVWRVPYDIRAVEAKAWARENNIQPAANDNPRIALLAIDVQNTFCIPDFELFAAGRSGRGAVEDNVRLCEFIYRHLGAITEIIPTMDTHTAMQIFHPVFWINDSGEHPNPMTPISYEEVENGTWKVNPAVAPNIANANPDWLQAYALHYAKRLNLDSKYPLMVWPYHAMLGGISHALVSAVEEACYFHNLARNSQTNVQLKGSNPLTENYSVLQPEVLEDQDGKPIAVKNTGLIERLLGFDAILVAGQAQSHCVAWTVRDLLDEIQARDPQLAQKVYLLEDCTSPVVVPGVVDYTDAANSAFDRFAEAGMHRVKSTEAIDSWLQC